MVIGKNKSGLKILWVSEYPPERGGISEYSKKLVDGISKRGHSIDIVSSTADTEHELDIKENVSFVESTPLSVDEWRNILSKDYDILQVQMPGNHISSLTLALFLEDFKGKSILTLHEIPDRFKVYFLFRQFDAISFLTENAEKEFKEKYRWFRVLENTEYFQLPYHGVEEPDISDQVLEEKSKDIKEESTTIVAPGFQVPRKKFEKVIDATNILQEQGKEVQLIFAGGAHRSKDGSYTEKLKKNSEILEEDSVKFTGVLDTKEKLEAYIKLADVCVLPYSDIKQSGILTDILKNGTKSIVSDVEGLRKPVETYGGVILDDTSPETIAKQIQKIDNREINIKSKEFIDENSWEENISRYLDIYSSLL
jgi:glycosyltransferase involved in cell wall biosynthesis